MAKLMLVQSETGEVQLSHDVDFGTLDKTKPFAIVQTEHPVVGSRVEIGRNVYTVAEGLDPLSILLRLVAVRKE